MQDINTPLYEVSEVMQKSEGIGTGALRHAPSLPHPRRSNFLSGWLGIYVNRSNFSDSSSDPSIKPQLM